MAGDRAAGASGRPAGAEPRDRLWEEAPALRKLTPRQKAGAVVVRDLLVYQLKLLLDGLKDLVLMWVSLGAAALDLVMPTEIRGKRFYASMHLGEKFDRWLNLYGAAELAAGQAEGLFGASRAGADSLLGKIEKMVLGHEEPEDPEKVPPGDRRR
jgi:hypothetical protein